MNPTKSEDGSTVFSADNVPVQGTGAGGAGVASKPRTFGVALEQLVILSHAGVPRVVARLCHYIERHGMQTERLFSTPTNQRSNQRCIAKMRADFDLYGDCNLERYGDVAAAAGCLKMFLRELPEAVVPARFTDEFVSALRAVCPLPRRCERMATLMQTLPAVHYALLRFLCSFLRRVTSFHCARHMTAETLGVMFGPNVFRVQEGYSGGPSAVRLQAATSRLVTHFISNYDSIFNIPGQRSQPQSARSERSDGVAPADQRGRIPESDSSACSVGLQQRVDKSIQDAVTSHLLNAVDTQKTDNGQGDQHQAHSQSVDKQPEKDVGDSQGSKSCQITEQETLGVSGGRVTGSSRRIRSHSEVVRTRNTASAARNGKRKNGASQGALSSKQIMLKGTETITVPLSPSYDWSLMYSDDEIDSTLSSSNSQCTDSSSARGPDQLMSRPERQKKQLPASSSLSRTNETRSRSCSVSCCQVHDSKLRGRQRCRELVKSEVSPQTCNEDKGERCKCNTILIPPLNLDGMCGDGEPALSPVQKSKQDSDVGVKSRNAFALSEIEFLREQKQRERAIQMPQVLLTTAGAARTPAKTRQQLRQNIANARRGLEVFSEDFQSYHGYKPSQADKQKDQAAQKCLQVISEAREKLKLLKQDTKTMSAASRVVAVDASTCTSSTNFQEKGSRACIVTGKLDSDALKQTVELITELLNEGRVIAGRPTNPESMCKEELLAEKAALQKALLGLEQKHGRPDRKRDRDLVRPLYERYRIIKRFSIKNTSHQRKESHVNEPNPVSERVSSTGRHVVNGLEDICDVAPWAKLSGDEQKHQPEESLNILPMKELMRELSKVRQDKRHLRDQMLAFEEECHGTVGKKIVEDSCDEAENNYTEYRQLKARIKVLEALLAKRGTPESFDM